MRALPGSSPPPHRGLRWLARALPLGFAIASHGCSSAPAPSSEKAHPDAAVAPSGQTAQAERIPLTIETESGPLTFQVEIADTPEERARGLMFRKSMGELEGMLFLFHAEEHQAFWMHNTYIPLDMVFIRADHTVLGVLENATPQTDTPRSVPGASQYVLELNGGAAAAKGIKAGQKVVFYAPIPPT